MKLKQNELKSFTFLEDKDSISVNNALYFGRCFRCDHYLFADKNNTNSNNREVTCSNCNKKYKIKINSKMEKTLSEKRISRTSLLHDMITSNMISNNSNGIIDKMYSLEEENIKLKRKIEEIERD